VGCCGGRYLWIRGLLPAAAVQDARVAALAELAELRPDKFAAGVPPQQGLAAPGATNLGLLGEREREREREWTWGGSRGRWKGPLPLNSPHDIES
jgi:hypothetical protein